MKTREYEVRGSHKLGEFKYTCSGKTRLDACLVALRKFAEEQGVSTWDVANAKIEAKQV